MHDISPQDRVTLLKDGITVLTVESDARGMHVCVSGRDEERVRKRVGEVLGDAVHVWVAGDTPRQLRPRACVGYLEREPGMLQLRYVVQGAQHVDAISLAEDDETVVVFGTVCMSVAGEDGEPIDCPAYLELQRPLQERTVIDGVSGAVVPYRNIYEGIEEPA
ncbi:hypothetical protein DVA67_017790 [Solirubrobacter sp. CPCC 204708]|uniref:Uncharacterized protein n=1 Tax=Solirubrobacter deserti TaxID=2282478 RepID=A0ABT4RCX0_9ACTN|nr:hypothetical protein [Solirubrobacter deserti]MBE2317839.1 hypothetical protein [Solirubrobacter deserti]MDA0136384.1 hypothetical protein [Solirubrobacter deserti]